MTKITNEDVIHGRAESYMCICCNCNRFMGSHEVMELMKDDMETLNMMDKKPVGYCPFCSNDAAKWNVFKKKDYYEFCKKNGKATPEETIQSE